MVLIEMGIIFWEMSHFVGSLWPELHNLETIIATEGLALRTINEKKQHSQSGRSETGT